LAFWENGRVGILPRIHAGLEAPPTMSWFLCGRTLMLINFFNPSNSLQCREKQSLIIPLNPPFIKGDKGMNRMVHAEGGFMLTYQMPNVYAFREDQDVPSAIKALIY
jgi:hypothetical protein